MSDSNHASYLCFAILESFRSGTKELLFRRTEDGALEIWMRHKSGALLEKIPNLVSEYVHEAEKGIDESGHAANDLDVLLARKIIDITDVALNSPSND